MKNIFVPNQKHLSHWVKNIFDPYSTEGLRGSVPLEKRLSSWDEKRL
jgi:hypothetical protein